MHSSVRVALISTYRRGVEAGKMRFLLSSSRHFHWMPTSQADIQRMQGVAASHLAANNIHEAREVGNRIIRLFEGQLPVDASKRVLADTYTLLAKTYCQSSMDAIDIAQASAYLNKALESVPAQAEALALLKQLEASNKTTKD
jgi:hypothetical protein